MVGLKKGTVWTVGQLDSWMVGWLDFRLIKRIGSIVAILGTTTTMKSPTGKAEKYGDVISNKYGIR
jgi:hypothetical protein